MLLMFCYITTEFRQLCLEIYMELVVQHVNPYILSEFIRLLFHQTTTNVDPFLDVLLKYSDFDQIPSIFLQYPVNKSKEINVNFKELNQEILIKYPSNAFTQSVTGLRVQENLIWPSIGSEWSLSIWLGYFKDLECRIDCKEMFIFSIGSENFVIEVWWNVSSMRIYYKLVDKI